MENGIFFAMDSSVLGALTFLLCGVFFLCACPPREARFSTSKSAYQGLLAQVQSSNCCLHSHLRILLMYLLPFGPLDRVNLWRREGSRLLFRWRVR